MLIQAAESVLIEPKVCVLVVTSGHQRADAHAFYEKNGYTWTGRRYKKTAGLSARGIERETRVVPRDSPEDR
jgi:hypothetical protein